MQSIVGNHPFLDGNKRTGFVAAKALLNEFGLDIKPGEVEEKFNFLHIIAQNLASFEEITNWISQRLVTLDDNSGLDIN